MMKKERNTEQKDALISYLKKNKNKHLSIQEIQNNLKDEIGLTTIYRIINNLIEKGEVTKTSLNGKQGFYYQYSDRKEKCVNHYHLICEKCNKLYHFDCDEILKVNQKINEKEHFIINNERTIFYGICKKCQNFICK